MTVTLPNGEPASGFMTEIYHCHFQLPNRGLLGANGLADERHFLCPVAAYEDKIEKYTTVAKYLGRLHQYEAEASPYCVVAWHGNYYPYKYDLEHFQTFGVSNFDHADPSIYTVLTAPIDNLGNTACDIVCFKPRWHVAEHSYRPDYFHRNAASEFTFVMGNNSKRDGLHDFRPMMTPHGVPANVYKAEIKRAAENDNPKFENADLSRKYIIMFESSLPLNISPYASKTPLPDAIWDTSYPRARI